VPSVSIRSSCRLSAEPLRAEVREFIAGELAAGLWVPNSDFGGHWSAALSRRLGARG